MNPQCIEHHQVGNKGGYGKGIYLGKRMLLHRIAYCFNSGTHPDMIEGLVIRHKCDNTRCINPKHLEVGTQADNVQDRVLRGRSYKPKGVRNNRAVLTPEDVVYIKNHFVHRDKEFGHTGLGRKFNVSHQTIRAIILGQTWL